MPANKSILLLIADDLGREQLGCYGCKALETPPLSKLASSGVTFDMAFTSTASCSGSRTVINTGLHTHQNGSYGLTHGRNGFQTLPDIETAPSLFNKLGYKTGIIGKVHVGPDHLYPWQHRQESESRDVAWVADQVDSFFSAAKEEQKPFYLTVGFVDPHRCSKRGGFGNDPACPDPRIKDCEIRPEDVTVPDYLSDIPEVRQELTEYYRAINRLDQGIGLILESLERQGLADDTLVLFLSDNGPPFVNSKTTLYEAGVRLPFIMRAPCSDSTAKVGILNPNMVSYVDILPTFLDWAGHTGLASEKNKKKRKGRSVLPILNHTERQAGWEFVFGSHTFHEITAYWPTRYMRTPRLKYHRNVAWRLNFPVAMDLYASKSFEGMRNSGKNSKDHPAMIGPRRLKDYIRRPAEELFDLDNDPLELCNLAALPMYADQLLWMRTQLEAWQRESEDLWLWKDGVAIIRYFDSGYAREGLCVPDRFDFDADEPSTDAAPAVKLLT